jgi:hypothetical protein
MKFNLIHPGNETLLAWTEGELSWWRGYHVGRHVRSCWQCKGQVSELEATISAVGLRVSEFLEPTRVDTAKAYWRFCEASNGIDAAPCRSRLRLKPAWTIAIAAGLATAGLAYVTTQQLFLQPVIKQASLPPPARISHAADAARESPVASVREAVMPAPSLPRGRMAETPRAAALSGPSESELLSAEVYSLAALHRSRFCLNSGVTVHRAGSAVEISGYIPSADQRDRLRSVLSGIGSPGIVEVRLSDSIQSMEQLQAGQDALGKPAAVRERIATPIEAWLRERLKVGVKVPEREVFNLMSAVVLELEDISGEAWAIRHLAEQFPIARAGQLNPELYIQLLQMVDDHLIALGNNLQMLHSRMRPLLDRPLTGNDGASTASAKQHWQSGVRDLQQHAERAVSELLESFSASAGLLAPGNSGTSRDFSEMLASLDGELRNCLAATIDLRAGIQAMSAKARDVQTRRASSRY